MDTKILLSALQEVEKRAERVSEDDVLATYVNVESLTAALGAKDTGIVFGRRGTGKTHALKNVTQTERRIGWPFFEAAAGLPALPVVTVPTLVIAGARDETVPLSDVAAWVDRTPSARLVTVDDGHELAASLDLILAEAWDFLRPLHGR